VRLATNGHPLRKARAVLTARSGGRSRAVALREERTRGTYTGRLVFPSAGRWVLAVRIRKARVKLGAITVGPPRSDVQEPFGLAFSDGWLAIADRGTNSVLLVNPHTGKSRKAATGLDNPIAVAYDASGSLYANSGERIMRLDAGSETLVAGTGTRGHSGDGGPATSAQLGGVGSFAFSPGDDLYVPEYDNWIRVVHATGKIDTVAGTGTEAFGGDGGPAKLAAIAAPHALTVRTDGSVVIADSHNGRIRRIDTAGKMSTLASRLGAPVSIAAAPDGSVVVGDVQTDQLLRIGVDGSAAVLVSRTRTPSGVAVDADGNVYFSEVGASRVRRIDARTGRVTTVAR
jgi:streptogramin lyase